MGGDGHQLGYLPQLDGLRGVAVLAVMVHHTAAYLLPGTFGWLARGGFLGVDLFFVLSGWLITRLIIDRHADGETTPGRFYLRRVRRLAPALVAFVAFTILWVYTVNPAGLPAAVRAGAVALSYIANYIDGADHLGHVWSLAVEEHFYLVWPVVLLAALNRKVPLRRVAVSLVVVIVAVVVWRATLWSATQDWSLVYRRTDTRADALAVGCLLAVAWPWLQGRRWPVVPATAGLAVAVLVVGRESPVLYLGGFTVVAALCAVLVAAGADGKVAWAQPRWLRQVGRLSYSLYLWHLFVFFAIVPTLIGPVAVAVGWSVSFLAAWGSWRLIEQPLRLRDREPVLVG